MKALAILEIAVACLFTGSGAIQLYRRTDGAPRVVGFPIERGLPSNGILGSHLRRRDKTVQITLENFVVSLYRTSWIFLHSPPRAGCQLLRKRNAGHTSTEFAIAARYRNS